MHYIATMSKDSTVVAAGFMMGRGVTRTTLVYEPGFVMDALKQAALERWLAARGVTDLRLCTRADLDERLAEGGQDDALVNLTGGSKFISMDLVSQLPASCPLFVLDAHGAAPLWRDLRAQTVHPVPADRWLTAQDWLDLNFYPGATTQAVLVCPGDPAPAGFEWVFGRLRARGYDQEALAVTETRHVTGRAPVSRAAVVVLRKGRPIVIAPRPLKAVSESPAWTMLEARSVKEALRNHKELTTQLTGMTGLPTWLKEPGDVLKPIPGRNGVLFQEDSVLKHYNSSSVTTLDQVGARGPNRAGALTPVKVKTGGRVMILLVGHQAMPQIAAALAARGPAERTAGEVVLIANKETHAQAEQIHAVLRQYRVPTLIAQVGAHQPEQVREIVLSCAQRASHLEVNCTGGTQAMALTAMLAAREVGADVAYTKGFETSVTGRPGPGRALGNVLTLEQYFQGLGYQATVMVDVEVGRIPDCRELADTRLAAAEKVIGTADVAARAQAYRAFAQALAIRENDYLQLRTKDGRWAELTSSTKPEEQLGQAYEYVVLGQLLRHLEQTGELGEPHLWRLGWSVKLHRDSGDRVEEAGTHEVDFVLMTSRDPIFLEVKYSLETALVYKDAHLRLASIARSHGANHVREAMVVHTLGRTSKEDL